MKKYRTAPQASSSEETVEGSAEATWAPVPPPGRGQLVRPPSGTRPWPHRHPLAFVRWLFPPFESSHVFAFLDDELCIYYLGQWKVQCRLRPPCPLAAEDSAGQGPAEPGHAHCSRPEHSERLRQGPATPGAGSPSTQRNMLGIQVLPSREPGHFCYLGASVPGHCHRAGAGGGAYF